MGKCPKKSDVTLFIFHLIMDHHNSYNSDAKHCSKAKKKTVHQHTCEVQRFLYKINFVSQKTTQFCTPPKMCLRLFPDAMMITICDSTSFNIVIL